MIIMCITYIYSIRKPLIQCASSTAMTNTCIKSCQERSSWFIPAITTPSAPFVPFGTNNLNSPLYPRPQLSPTHSPLAQLSDSTYIPLCPRDTKEHKPSLAHQRECISRFSIIVTLVEESRVKITVIKFVPVNHDLIFERTFYYIYVNFYYIQR